MNDYVIHELKTTCSLPQRRDKLDDSSDSNDSDVEPEMDPNKFDVQTGLAFSNEADAAQQGWQ